jgi:hypothetical protein
VGCADVQSHGEFVPDAPFAQFTTFSFAANEAPPAAYHLSARSAVVVEQMKPMVAEVMQKKGYSPAPDGTPGDITIAVGAGRRESEEHVHVNHHITSLTGEEYEDRDFTEGGIVIDAFDKSGGQIWHGAAATSIDPQKPDPRSLRAVVEAALTKFPHH